MNYTPSRKHGIGLGIGLIVLGVGLAGIAILVSWANQPVVQDIHPQNAPKITEIRASQAIRTKFYSAEVPGDYQVQVTVNPNNSSMVQAVAYSGASPKMQFGITTNLLPTDGLLGVADYKLRISERDQYQSIADERLPATGKTFRKTDGTPEIALFITNGPRYASIVASGNTDEEQVLSQLATFYDSWNWL